MTMEGFIQFAPRAVVVDDEPAIREYVAMVARQAGFEVDLAASGAELIAHLAQPFPHIIVLDMNMVSFYEFAMAQQLTAALAPAGSEPRRAQAN